MHIFHQQIFNMELFLIITVISIMMAIKAHETKQYLWRNFWIFWATLNGLISILALTNYV